MQAELKKIVVPREFTQEVIVSELHVTPGMRVYRDMDLATLHVAGHPFILKSPYHGWVKLIFVKPEQFVKKHEVLMLLSVLEVQAYRPDEQEVNLESELGQEGRRGLEREGQNKFGQPDKALFDAPSQQQGMGHSSLKQNPLLAGMKEGVPPKMRASGQENAPATQDLIERSETSPQLQAKLTAELQNQLQMDTPAPSAAPTLTRT